MKKITKACAAGILLGAALFCVAKHANAEIIAYTPNTEGGTIQFSDQQGTCATSWHGAVVVTSEGEVATIGCWSYAEPNVVTNWGTYGTRYYSLAGIVLTEAGKKLGN